MVLSFIVETTLRTSAWAISKTYDGVTYLIYGPRTDPVLSKLEDLEKKLYILNHPEENTPDHIFYQKTKHLYQHNQWIIINLQKLIYQTDQKTKVLRAVADLVEQHPDQKYLVIQVGNEQNTFTI